MITATYWDIGIIIAYEPSKYWKNLMEKKEDHEGIVKII